MAWHLKVKVKQKKGMPMPSAGARMKGPKDTELLVEFIKVTTSISHKTKCCNVHVTQEKEKEGFKLKMLHN